MSSYILNSDSTDNCRRCGDIDDFCDGNESEKLCKHCLDHCCEECFNELESPEEESKHICKECDEDSTEELKYQTSVCIRNIVESLPYMTKSQIEKLNEKLSIALEESC